MVPSSRGRSADFDAPEDEPEAQGRRRRRASSPTRRGELAAGRARRRRELPRREVLDERGHRAPRERERGGVFVRDGREGTNGRADDGRELGRRDARSVRGASEGLGQRTGEVGEGALDAVALERDGSAPGEAPRGCAGDDDRQLALPRGRLRREPFGDPRRDRLEVAIDPRGGVAIAS